MGSFIIDTSTFEVQSRFFLWKHEPRSKSVQWQVAVFTRQASRFSIPGRIWIFYEPGKIGFVRGWSFTAFLISEAFDSDVLEHPAWWAAWLLGKLKVTRLACVVDEERRRRIVVQCQGFWWKVVSWYMNFEYSTLSSKFLVSGVLFHSRWNKANWHILKPT